MMKKSLLNTCLIIGLVSFSFANAGSNNGYTTGANLYTGSSSRGWYGGGVAYRLAEWRKEKDIAEETDNTVSTTTEDTATAVDNMTEQAPISAQNDVVKPIDNTAELSPAVDASTSAQDNVANKEGTHAEITTEVPKE